MKTVYLVSCVGKKADHPAYARELYVSDWFLKARAYVEAQACNWFILSAKHGLLRVDSVISPYEQTLIEMNAAERRRWADRVMAALGVVVEPGDRVVILAGERYREHLVPGLTSRGITVEVPMQGLSIGQQLRWLKEGAANVQGAAGPGS